MVQGKEVGECVRKSCNLRKVPVKASDQYPSARDSCIIFMGLAAPGRSPRNSAVQYRGREGRGKEVGSWFSCLDVDSQHLGSSMQKAFAEGGSKGRWYMVARKRAKLQRSKLESLQSLSMPGNWSCGHHAMKGWFGCYGAGRVTEGSQIKSGWRWRTGIYALHWGVTEISVLL